MNKVFVAGHNGLVGSAICRRLASDGVEPIVAGRDALDLTNQAEVDAWFASHEIDAVYLAAAPKSNSVYRAYSAAAQDVRDHPDAQVPMHIRNAPTQLMKDVGYGQGYVYEHDTAEALSAQEFLPEELEGAEYYTPGPFGFEKEIAKRMDYWQKLKAKLKNEQAEKEADLH